MNTKIIIVICFAMLGILGDTMGQKTKSNGKSADSFPELIYTNVKGAPKLGKPILIYGESKPVIGAGLGWAAPVMWDWDRDGKKDLLIGEFGSGQEIGHSFGNFIRVYENKSSTTLPRYSDNFYYAYYVGDERISHYGKNDEVKYPKHLVNYGTPISIPQFCCMAFKPQFADLNGDGYVDLYTGRYSPGLVYWFRGSELGFLPGEKLKQEGNPTALKINNSNYNDPNDWTYWSYSAVSFGEFTGDDLPDMIVGGNGLRISKNIGTKSNPEVGLREELNDQEGKPLWNGQLYGSAVPFVVDWDQDGILDMLVTNAYSKAGGTAVMFFKGRQKGSALFEKGVPLFTVRDNGKAFPGNYLNLSVADWNNDGVNDIIIGARVAVLNGKFDHNLNWGWESDRGYLTSKSGPGWYSSSKIKEIDEKIKKVEQQEKKLKRELGIAEFLKRKKEARVVVDREKYTTKEDLLKQYYCGDEKYKTLIHQGFVYVMLGQK